MLINKNQNTKTEEKKNERITLKRIVILNETKTRGRQSEESDRWRKEGEKRWIVLPYSECDTATTIQTDRH